MMKNDLIDNNKDMVSKRKGKAELSAAATSVSTPIKYAPVIKPVSGNINLYCIALRWLDDNGVALNRVTNAGRQTAKIYAELSSNRVKFKVIARQVKVNFGKSAKNLPKAEKYAKSQMPKLNDDRSIYAIVNNRAKKFSNAGGDTAHLMGALTRDFLHEVGHLRPFSLGHSGRYVNGKLEAYGDGTSFMGRFASTRLTGAQLYLLGWLPQNKVGLYDLGDEATDFNIESLYSDNSSTSLKVVLIPRVDQRHLYLSMPQIQGKPTLCLHLSSGRGTQRVAAFGARAEYQGLRFERISLNDRYVSVRISTDKANNQLNDLTHEIDGDE